MATIRIKLIISFFILFLFFFLLPLQSCDKSDSLPENQGLEILVTDESVQSILLKQGVQEIVFDLDNGAQFKFMAYAPEDIKNPPLILALHWAGDETTYQTYGPCQAIDGFKDSGAIILIPSSAGGIWWDQSMYDLMVDLIDKTVKHWNVDREKVAITGYSNGGSASWLYAEVGYNVFSAAIPICGSYGSSPKFDIPIYAIHGENDELFPFTSTEQVVQGSIAKGSDITWIKAAGRSHFEGCMYKEYVQAASEWLKNEVWK